VTEPNTIVTTVADGIARITWSPDQPVDVVRHEVAAALVDHARVEALVDPDDESAQRTATWSGLRREGVMRGVTVDGRPVDRIVYARLATDTPVHEPEGFRALLNSFLPRKRAISQLLLRSSDARVLLCQLTYKQDWDLPGGVVEVGESPQVAVAREVEEELGLSVVPGRLLLTDWLPPWSGWDDALCLVFDGGVHEHSLLDSVVRQTREIRSAEFCTPEQVLERCADFTARRVAAALANLDGAGATYTESGHA
jgi:8-oxo-dGTP pyrophosphatase MutT (NUDIX family)